MAFCSKCGSSMKEGMSFCPACGAPVQAAAAAPATPAQTPTTITQPAPASGTTSGAGLAPNVAGLLAYIPGVGWIVAIVFLVVEPFNRDKFVRFHAYQSIFLAVASVIVSIVFSIVERILWHIPVLGWAIDILVGLLSLVVWLGILATHLFMMYKAYQNQKYKLPVIGNMAEQQAAR